MFVCESALLVATVHRHSNYNFVYMSFCPPIPKRGGGRERQNDSEDSTENNYPLSPRDGVSEGYMVF